MRRWEGSEGALSIVVVVVVATFRVSEAKRVFIITGILGSGSRAVG